MVEPLHSKYFGGVCNYLYILISGRLGNLQGCFFNKLQSLGNDIYMFECIDHTHLSGAGQSFRLGEEVSEWEEKEEADIGTEEHHVPQTCRVR